MTDHKSPMTPREQAAILRDALETLMQAVEGHRAGALTNDGLWHSWTLSCAALKEAGAQALDAGQDRTRVDSAKPAHACNDWKPTPLIPTRCVNCGFHISQHGYTGETRSAEALDAGGWTSVADTMPKDGQAVIAYFRNSFGKHRRIRAAYYGANQLPVDCDHEIEGSTFGEDGEEYCPPGWYENNEYEEVHFRVTDTITHWQPLPAPPGDHP